MAHRLSARLIVIGWGFFVAGLAAAPMQAQNALPSYAATEAFGHELADDFNTRKVDAILDRIDVGSLVARCVDGLGQTAAEENLMGLRLRETMPNILSVPLAPLKDFSRAQVSRIITDRGRRMLECLFERPNGSFNIIVFTVDQPTRGTLKLRDFRALGSTRTFIEMMRRAALMSGETSHAPLPEPEARLEEAVRPYRAMVGFAMFKLREKEYDLAFSQWARLPPELQAFPEWRDIRHRLANLGSKLAKAHVEAEAARGLIFENAFARYGDATVRRDEAAALLAIDEAIKESDQLPLLRLLKVRHLVAAKRLPEAASIARHVRELNPLLIGGHVFVILVAVEQGKLQDAMAALNYAAELVTAEGLDPFLENEPSLASLRAGKSYQDWLKAAREATLTGQAASPEKP